jgi:DNA-binding MarR family transcriptional regulator
VSNPLEVMQTCAAMRSRTVARKITRLYDEALRPVGITLGQFTTLIGISIARPKSISGFAEKLGMERSTLTRNLKVLETMGLIEIGPEQYRRSREMRVTAKGERVLEEAYPHWERAQDALRGRIGGEDWQSAHDVFNRLMTKL